MISNVNGHYAPILLLNSERLSFLPNVSDHCSPIHQDYIQVHKAGDRILLFLLYAYPATPVPFLSDALANYQE